jgi:N-methylhydantoinase A
VRVSLRAAIPGAAGAPWRSGAGAVGEALKGHRPAYFAEAPAAGVARGFRETPVYDRYLLPSGASFAGPAIVEERESTLVVGPGGRFAVDAAGNLIVELPA